MRQIDLTKCDIWETHDTTFNQNSLSMILAWKFGIFFYEIQTLTYFDIYPKVILLCQHKFFFDVHKIKNAFSHLLHKQI